MPGLHTARGALAHAHTIPGTAAAPSGTTGVMVQGGLFKWSRARSALFQPAARRPSLCTPSRPQNRLCCAAT